MSFSARVKKEIGQHGNHGRHCQIAELLALVLATGEVELKDGQVKVIMRPENVLIGDKLCYLMDKIFGKEVLTTRHSKYIEIANQDMADRLLLHMFHPGVCLCRIAIFPDR